MVTDDLTGYRTGAKEPGLKHQVCPFHVRHWACRAPRVLRETIPREWVWVLDEAKPLLTELPAEGSWRLFERWQQIPERHPGKGRRLTPLSRLRGSLLRLSEHGPSYRVLAGEKGVPWTNNGAYAISPHSPTMYVTVTRILTPARAPDILWNGSGPLAQLAEQGTLNPKVAGSSPARPTIPSPQERSLLGAVLFTGGLQTRHPERQSRPLPLSPREDRGGLRGAPPPHPCGPRARGPRSSPPNAR